jgi:hypothetical protein
MSISVPPLYIMRHNYLNLVACCLHQFANVGQCFLCAVLIDMDAPRISMRICPGGYLPLSSKQPDIVATVPSKIDPFCGPDTTQEVSMAWEVTRGIDNVD